MNNKIAEDLKNTMKSGDKFKLSVLRMLKSALLLESKAVKKDYELSDEEVIKVIKKQVKTRKDSITEYQKYEKFDEVSALEKEIEILNVYLPAEMSEEEINKIIDEVFASLKPTSMKDMGGVMKELNAKITNADMSLVSKIVKERLS
ncbi:MAG: GatB/YqeY domain-containing protein [Bacilli bacterium]|nr:GatB/YqeY domain-containing protein [Bacilli bacterium]